jgi:hypothetical protein
MVTMPCGNKSIRKNEAPIFTNIAHGRKTKNSAFL